MMDLTVRRTEGPRPRAVVLGVQLPQVADEAFEASLRELERLADTLGLEVVGRVTQRRGALAAAAVVGVGKLLELGRWTGGTGVVPSYAPPGKRKGKDAHSVQPDEPPGDEAEDEDEAPFAARLTEREPGVQGPLGAGEPDSEASADAREPAEDARGASRGPDSHETARDGEAPEARAAVVLVDHELSPSQVRNLEKATGAEVFDRAMVILSIFQRHARTREARTQVEIARLSYLAPRLREAHAGQDRQRGGIGGKGAGETAVELDRRRVRDRIAELRRELDELKREADTRRSRRLEGDVNTVALVGYTNAGKSSLMRALTGDEVYVADQLFATLDTTVRVLKPATRPRILVSDTVGFIKKLPHDLVASFRSTLQEAQGASLLLHVVDASDPAFRDQLQVTHDVLAEIGAGAQPSLLVLNKADRLNDTQRAALVAELPAALLICARAPADVARVRDAIVAFFEQDMEEAQFLVSYQEQRKLALLRERCRVLDEHYDEAGTRVRVRGRPAVLRALAQELSRG